jgi:cell division protein FtsL
LTMATQNRVSCMMMSRNCQTGIRIHNLPRKGNRFRLTPRQVPLIIGLLIAFMGSGIGYVWSNHEKTQIGYDIAQLKKEEMRLLETNRKLRLEMAFLKSPANLEAHAVKRFGLRQPTPDQIVVLP